jgi:uncharacterized protein (UPF0264 family)
LLTAVAGGLSADELGPACAAGPDIIGVRGAACDGGRQGAISANRVAALQQALRRYSGFVQV